MSSIADPILGSKVDFTLWATNRVAAYETSVIQKKDQPLAIFGSPRSVLRCRFSMTLASLLESRGWENSGNKTDWATRECRHSGTPGWFFPRAQGHCAR